MDEKAHEINRIILWLRQVKQIEELERLFGLKDVHGKIECKKALFAKFLFWTPWMSYNTEKYVMEDEEICLFLDFIRERKAHIQKLIDETDKEKVELAQLVLSGEITSKGLMC